MSLQTPLYRRAGNGALSPDSRFNFRCHEGLACFNRCCRTPTIILSPYDLLRLRHCLGITSGEFLERYTREIIEESSNLPLVCIDPHRSPDGGCPFLGADGCMVYPHRPAACRLFPITMGSRLTEHGVVDYYFCRKLDYCQGFAADVPWTVESWKANQGFAEYDQGRRPWIETMLRAGLQGGVAIDAQVHDLFATLAYDLDRFRRLIFEPAFLQVYDLDAEALAEVETDDTALLRLSYRVLPTILSSEGARVMSGIIRSSTKFFEAD